MHIKFNIAAFTLWISRSRKGGCFVMTCEGSLHSRFGFYYEFYCAGYYTVNLKVKVDTAAVSVLLLYFQNVYFSLLINKCNIKDISHVLLQICSRSHIHWPWSPKNLFLLSFVFFFTKSPPSISSGTTKIGLSSQSQVIVNTNVLHGTLSQRRLCLTSRQVVEAVDFAVRALKQ